MRQNQKNNRMRNRPRKGGGGNGGNPTNNLNRSYESNGPDVKVRGTPHHIAEKYQQLARDATSAGDRVAAENYYQHAEHYMRMIAAAQAQQAEILERRRQEDERRREQEERRREQDERWRAERPERQGGDRQGGVRAWRNGGSGCYRNTRLRRRSWQVLSDRSPGLNAAAINVLLLRQTKPVNPGPLRAAKRRIAAVFRQFRACSGRVADAVRRRSFCPNPRRHQSPGARLCVTPAR